MPAVSIIIPVYNSEAWLARCIESVLNQTFTDFELILVDDGSTDGSGAICDQYASTDSRVLVYHKPNGGVSSARNLGLEHAKGDYILFVDSDDWIEPTTLKAMYGKAKGAEFDMLIANLFIEENRGGQRIYNQCISKVESNKSLVERLLDHRLKGFMFNKLIRTSLFNDFGVRFEENISYCEDLLVCVQLLAHPIKVGFIDEAFVHYNQENPAQITKNISSSTARSISLMLEKLSGIITPACRNAYRNLVLEFTGDLYANTSLPNSCLCSMPSASSAFIVKSALETPVHRHKKLHCLLVKIFGLKVGRYIARKLL